MNYTISEEILETLLACQTPMEVTMVVDEIKRKNPEKNIDWGVKGREGMAKRAQSLKYYVSDVIKFDEYKKLGGHNVWVVLKTLEDAFSEPYEG